MSDFSRRRQSTGRISGLERSTRPIDPRNRRGAVSRYLTTSSCISNAQLWVDIVAADLRLSEGLAKRLDSDAPGTTAIPL